MPSRPALLPALALSLLALTLPLPSVAATRPGRVRGRHGARRGVGGALDGAPASLLDGGGVASKAVVAGGGVASQAVVAGGGVASQAVVAGRRGSTAGAAAAAAAVAAGAGSTVAPLPTTAAPHPLPTSSTPPPVLIVINTGHYFGDGYARANFTCKTAGGAAEFQCTFSEDRLKAGAADALWYHLPTAPPVGPYPGGSFRARPDQVTIAASMESAAYYPSLDDRAYMARFDVEATYRLSADVLLGYFNEGHTAAWASTPPVPFAQKEAAIAYLSSNCGAPSGRDAIVGDLMALPDALPVHALGACRNNRPSPPSRQQVDTLKNYRFCIAMENSIADDYVSEKVYAALVAGCLPIYYGPANAADFVPSPDSIIDWRRFNGSARALMDEVTRLNGDEAAYAATQAWRTQPPESWSPAFRALRARLGLEETQCHQCRLVAEKRASGWRKDN